MKKMILRVFALFSLSLASKRERFEDEQENNESFKIFKRRRMLTTQLENIIAFNEDVFLSSGNFPTEQSQKHVCLNYGMQSVECLNYCAPFSRETFPLHTEKVFTVAKHKSNEDQVSFRKRKNSNKNKLIDWILSIENVDDSWIETQCKAISESDVKAAFDSGGMDVISLFSSCLRPEYFSDHYEKSSILALYAPKKSEIPISLIVPHFEFLSIFLQRTTSLMGIRFFMTIIGDKMWALLPEQIQSNLYGFPSEIFTVGYHMLIEKSLQMNPGLFNCEEIDSIQNVLYQLKIMIAYSISKKCTSFYESTRRKSRLLRSMKENEIATFQAGNTQHSQIVMLQKIRGLFRVKLVDGSSIFQYRGPGKGDPIYVISGLMSIEELENENYFLFEDENLFERGSRFQTEDSGMKYKIARGCTCPYSTLKHVLKYLLPDQVYYKLKYGTRKTLIDSVRGGIDLKWMRHLSTEAVFTEHGDISERQLINTILHYSIVESQMHYAYVRVYSDQIEWYNSPAEEILREKQESRELNLAEIIVIWASLSLEEWKIIISRNTQKLGQKDKTVFGKLVKKYFST